MPTISVCATNSIHKVPLLIEGAIGREQRIALVINVSGLRSRTIQFDDFEVLATQQVGIVRVTNVVSAEKEARYSPRNLVDTVAELCRDQVAAVSKVTLDDAISLHAAKITLSIRLTSDQLESCPALAHVGLQH